MNEHDHSKNMMCCGNPVSARSMATGKSSFAPKAVMKDESESQHEPPERHGEYR